MAGARLIMSAAVREARHTGRISISGPGDFTLGPLQPLDRAAVTQDPLLPYCLDFLHRRALYVAGIDPKGAQDAPFYYLYLRRNARRVVFVPWEAGPLASGVARAPVFLFSPGRCGSTLLARILSAGGTANVSEPDFYTQLTGALCASPYNPWRPQIQAAVAAMGTDLAAALDPRQSPVVKLRAESCRAPELLLQSREPRTLFMTRGFEAWARSNGRAFGNPARKTVGKYLRAMTCYAWQKRHSDCHLVRYEDLLAAPLPATQALARFLGRDIAADTVTATMKEDSQDGTPLGQGARPDKPGWERRFDETMALWNSATLRRARDRLDADELQTG
jgi:hypothetical protein